MLPAPHNGVRILNRHRKHPRSRYTAVSSKPKTDVTEIDSDALPPSPWNPETPEIQNNHWLDRYFGSFRRPRKSFKVEPTPNLWIKNILLEVLNENGSFPSKINKINNL
ncbi:unnamed protein product [Hymenolepis diminuta]|uniref:Uncharacterized protein n=1 Tax=Hymenolepis diminuta TaxID=6216 RepID=A0A0R3SDA8_HYMDI|nr:unnamed protein product [Hymenolepis diminuta]